MDCAQLVLYLFLDNSLAVCMTIGVAIGVSVVYWAILGLSRLPVAISLQYPRVKDQAKLTGVIFS